MVECPNPNCDGQLIVQLPENEYMTGIECDSCPFYISERHPVFPDLDQHANELLDEASHKLAEYAVKKLAGMDWDAWEKDRLDLLNKIGRDGLSYREREYWKKRKL